MKRKVYNNALAGLWEMRRAYDGEDKIELRHPDWGPYGNHTLYLHQPTQALALATEDTICHVGNTACSYGLVNPDLEDAEAIASLTMTKAEQTSLSYTERERFMDWLINRSPYAKCIRTNSPKFAVENGIILDTHYPANLVVGAVIAQRLVWEFQSLLKGMLKFIDLGMNEDAAFVLTHQYGIMANLRVYESYYAGHTAIHGGRVTKEYLKGFVQDKPYTEMKSYYEKNTYNNIQKLWGNDDLLKYDFLKEASRNVVKVKNDVPNPFAKTLKLDEVGGNPEEIAKSFVKLVNDIVEE